MTKPAHATLRALGLCLGLFQLLHATDALAAQKRLRANAGELPEPLSRPVRYFGDVHPVLIERCVSCHGPEKQKGGLRLDSRERALAGGETYGPAIIPGKSAESPLLLFMAHLEPDMEMPPKKEDRLSDATVALVRAWIDQGADWPSKQGAPAGAAPVLGNQELFFKKAATHWAFQPVRSAEVDSLAHGPRSIDVLVEAERKRRGLSASPRADGFTLLRRLHFDLTGLPPSPVEMDAFLGAFSKDPDAAVAAKVEELLSSSHFGERWGRYWLDIARYADAQDLFPNQDLRYPFAWTYRDYVIKAFNSDKPYDRFVREQIAADLLGLPTADATLAALGFLTVGPRFLRKEIEQINDRIDVVTRGIMGLTVACARCHNHKFDPIPTADYYALYGVFQSSVLPDPLPIIHLPEFKLDSNQSADYEASKARTRGELDALNERERSKAIAETLAKPQDYFGALSEIEYGKKTINGILNTTSLSGVALASLSEQRRTLKKNAKNVRDHVMGPLAAILSAAPVEHAGLLQTMRNSGRVPGTDTGLHEFLLELLRDLKPETEDALMRLYGTLLAKAVASPQSAMALQVQNAFTAKDSLLDFSRIEVEKSAANTVAARQEYRKLHGQLAETENTHPGAPIRAMVLKDAAKPVKPVVFVRGDPANRGDAVERRFLEVLDPKKTPFSAEQSGRLELAEAVTHPANPLTPRVWANQVWRHLIGRSLVKATSDFGLQSDPPTHPELLDWLASALVQRGWSTKQLVRDIVLSAAYQQSSGDRPAATENDPDNIWLWRANRRRLDVEAMRDAMLAVSGRIDPAAGGRAVSLTSEPFSGRRTVYGFVDRVQTNPMLVTFDFPSPDTASTERTQTMVPQQALFALNDAFIIAQAKALVAGVEQGQRKDGVQPAAVGVRSIYRRVFQRLPTDEEQKLAGELLSASDARVADIPAGVWQYGYGNADPEVPRHEAFAYLSFFDPKVRRYQGSSQFPDRVHGFASISEGGGHPGDGIHRAAIRRWIAPRDGGFSISGELSVSPKGSGDGVRARVISSRTGLLGEWIIDRLGSFSTATLIDVVPLKAGEILDFTVDSMATNSGDGFRWAPALRDLRRPEDTPKNVQTVWEAQADFKAPPPAKLTPLERLAQALLMSNEFMFVD